MSNGVERNLLVPLSDGETLAVDVYLPAEQPSPAIVSYYPYHKDDVIGGFFEYANRYFAEQGYAAVLADFRGLGSSSGLPGEAMNAREADDGAELVEWIAAQPWCDGSVGMWGLSYGGITSFKTAAVQPPHLKAIVPVIGSADIYLDWVYPGGCLNCLGLMGWGSYMVAMQMVPPMFQDPDGHWMEVWWNRLHNARPYILDWHAHPERDAFWDSKTTPVENIEVPAFLIGGWRDIFPEGMVSPYSRLSGPRKLLMGPWLHCAPDQSPFEPVDYLAEITRWWDRWLRDQPNGVEDEPPVTLYVQTGEGGEGRWKNEEAWPAPAAGDTPLFLCGDRLYGEVADRSGSRTYRADPTLGSYSVLWDPMALGLGNPQNQAPEDVLSLAYTSEPIEDAMEITGSPEAVLYVSVDEGDEANLVVKLCDVAPSGHSTLISTGWLKLTHRESHRRSVALVPGEVVEARVAVWATSYEVAAGHRLRVSVSCADFPRIWPTITNPLIRLYTGIEHPSRISLPVVPTEASGPVTKMPRPDPDLDRAPLGIDYAPKHIVTRDHGKETVTVEAGFGSTMHTPSLDGRAHVDTEIIATVSRHRPDGARLEGNTTFVLDTPSGSRVVVDARTRVSAREVTVWGRVEADGVPIFEHRWHS